MLHMVTRGEDVDLESVCEYAVRSLQSPDSSMGHLLVLVQALVDVTSERALRAMFQVGGITKLRPIDTKTLARFGVLSAVRELHALVAAEVCREEEGEKEKKEEKEDSE